VSLYSLNVAVPLQVVGPVNVQHVQPVNNEANEAGNAEDQIEPAQGSVCVCLSIINYVSLCVIVCIVNVYFKVVKVVRRWSGGRLGYRD